LLAMVSGTSPSVVKRGAVVEISIYNVIGGKIGTTLYHESAKDQEVEINVSGLTPGIYFLEVAAETKTFRSKFVKQ